MKNHFIWIIKLRGQNRQHFKTRKIVWITAVLYGFDRETDSKWLCINFIFRNKNKKRAFDKTRNESTIKNIWYFWCDTNGIKVKRKKKWSAQQHRRLSYGRQKINTQSVGDLMVLHCNWLWKLMRKRECKCVNMYRNDTTIDQSCRIEKKKKKYVVSWMMCIICIFYCVSLSETTSCIHMRHFILLWKIPSEITMGVCKFIPFWLGKMKNDA